MPQRTNAFQSLFHRIEGCLAGDDSRVTESALLYSRGSRKKEEIDVVVERQGEIPYRVGFQCQDRNRKAGASWIRDMVKQRDDCGIDIMIAVHSMGFTKAAENLANANGIRLYTLRKISAVNWDSRRFEPMELKMSPTIFKIAVLSQAKKCWAEVANHHLVKMRESSRHCWRSAHDVCASLTRELSVRLAERVVNGEKWVVETAEVDARGFDCIIEDKVISVESLRVEMRASDTFLPVIWSPYILNTGGKVREVLELVHMNHGYEVRVTFPDGFKSQRISVACRDVRDSNGERSISLW